MEVFSDKTSMDRILYAIFMYENNDLSVNRSNLPPTDDGGSEMDERFIAFGKLLISDQEFSEPVEPRMCSFHNPASVLGWTSTSSLLLCNPWSISTRAYLFVYRVSVIAFIRTQEPLFPLRKAKNDGIEHCTELTDVMSIRPGNDQQQRDATTVHQDVSLASPFFPGLWGSGRLLPVLEGL